MRLKILFLLVFMSVATTSTARSKNESAQIYVYGFAASFNDSTVYFTDIQLLDSAYIGKNGFLYGRDSYSYQLKQYLESIGVFQPTCITCFATSRRAIEKKFASLDKKYIKESYYNIKYITAVDFSYIPVVPEPPIEKKATTGKKTKSKNNTNTPVTDNLQEEKVTPAVHP